MARQVFRAFGANALGKPWPLILCQAVSRLACAARVADGGFSARQGFSARAVELLLNSEHAAQLAQGLELLFMP